MHLPRLASTWRYWSYAKIAPDEQGPVESWTPPSLMDLVQEHASLRGRLILPEGQELSVQGTVTGAGDGPSKPPGPPSAVIHLTATGAGARYELCGVLAPSQDQLVGLLTSPGNDPGGRPAGGVGLFLMVRA